MITIEQIKKEVFYYSGKNISDEEADEILYFAEQNPSASLCEIISGYYNC